MFIKLTPRFFKVELSHGSVWEIFTLAGDGPDENTYYFFDNDLPSHFDQLEIDEKVEKKQYEEVAIEDLHVDFREHSRKLVKVVEKLNGLVDYEWVHEQLEHSVGKLFEAAEIISFGSEIDVPEVKRCATFLMKNAFRFLGLTDDEYLCYTNSNIDVCISMKDNKIVFVDGSGEFLQIPINEYALLGALIRYRQIPILNQF